MCILDSRDQVLRRKTVRLVRVLWRHCGVKESTWEREDTMRATYPVRPEKFPIYGIRAKS